MAKTRNEGILEEERDALRREIAALRAAWVEREKQFAEAIRKCAEGAAAATNVTLGAMQKALAESQAKVAEQERTIAEIAAHHDHLLLEVLMRSQSRAAAVAAAIGAWCSVYA